MLTYFLEATLVWSILFGVYYFTLKGETYFHWNRYFLLMSLFLGLFFPLIQWPVEVSPSTEVLVPAYYLEPIILGVDNLETQIVVRGTTQTWWSWSKVLLLFYAIGAGYQLLRYGKGYAQLYQLFKEGKKTIQSQYTTVEHQLVASPFSFFNLLFLSNAKDYKPWELESIEKHEWVHIKEGHSIDVVLVSLLEILFWWCPIIPMYHKAIKLNHEYIADRYVLNHIQPVQYGHLLLRQTLSGKGAVVGNHFSLQLKKRFQMMKRAHSKPIRAIKYWLLIPFVAMLFTAFALQVNAVPHLSNDFGTISDIQTDSIGKPLAMKEMDYFGAIRLSRQVDRGPLFLGCTEGSYEEQMACSHKAMMTYIYQQITYPQAARAEGITGEVSVKFFIDEKGAIADAEVIHGIGGGCDETFLNLIKEMPTWQPATQNGQSVKVGLILTVNYILEGDEKPDVTLEEAPKKDNNVTVVGYLPEKAFKEVDEMPLFPGCDEASLAAGESLKACADRNLIQFIYDHIRYPEAAVKAKQEGMAVIKFIVEKDGSITNAEIARELAHGCDEEVKRVVELMPNWVPGKLDGKPVRTIMHLPVKYALGADREINEDTNLGMARELTVQNFTASPNPTTGVINVQFETTAGDIDIRIMNISGQTVFDQTFDGFDGQFQGFFDLKDQPVGTYFLKVVQGNRVYTQKVVKR